MNDSPLPVPASWDVELQKIARLRTRRRFWSTVSTLALLGVALFASLFLSEIVIKAIFGQGVWSFDFCSFLFLFIVGAFSLVGWGVGSFWPFVLLFFGLNQTYRRQTLTALIQNCLKSNAPLSSAIRAYAATLFFSYYKINLNNLASALDSGTPLHRAAAYYPGLFSAETVSLIRLHENAPEAIDLATQNLTNERNSPFLQVSSLFRFVYLLILLWTFLSLGTFVFCMFIPKFMEIINGFDAPLPKLTATVFFFEKFLISSGITSVICLLFFAITVAAIVFLFMKLDICRLRPPFLRRFFRYSDSARLLRFLGLGIQKNVPLSRSLNVYRQSLQSDYLRKQIDRIQKTIDSGGSWIDALSKRRVVNRNEAALLKTSVQAGNCGVTLNELGNSQEAKQNRSDDLISKIVFVFLMFITGTFVALWSISMLVPLFRLISVCGY